MTFSANSVQELWTPPPERQGNMSDGRMVLITAGTGDVGGRLIPTDEALDRSVRCMARRQKLWKPTFLKRIRSTRV